MGEKAQNKRMKNPSLSARDSLHDEVAYVLTLAALLKEVQSAVKTNQQKRWQPKRQKTSDFRKCENAAYSAAAINRTCSRHPERLMMACSTVCHKIANKQRRENLASIQPQTDADMSDAEIATLTESKEFPLHAPTKLMHKWTMTEGLLFL
jgi:hypothetical protein